jgi:hypothetical protein
MAADGHDLGSWSNSLAWLPRLYRRMRRREISRHRGRGKNLELAKVRWGEHAKRAAPVLVGHGLVASGSVALGLARRRRRGAPTRHNQKWASFRSGPGPSCTKRSPLDPHCVVVSCRRWPQRGKSLAPLCLLNLFPVTSPPFPPVTCRLPNRSAPPKADLVRVSPSLCFLPMYIIVSGTAFFRDAISSGGIRSTAPHHIALGL